jgi:hydrogenase nickel incorporation protein HypA/HybF
MHELAVTESILEIALRHAKERNAKSIKNLYLVIGDWSSIIDDSIQFYWDIISDGTIAEGAALHFQRIPVILVCKNCANEYRPSQGDLACPECSATQVEVMKGKEFLLDAIDVDY